MWLYRVTFEVKDEAPEGWINTNTGEPVCFGNRIEKEYIAAKTFGQIYKKFKDRENELIGIERLGGVAIEDNTV